MTVSRRISAVLTVALLLFFTVGPVAMAQDSGTGLASRPEALGASGSAKLDEILRRQIESADNDTSALIGSNLPNPSSPASGLLGGLGPLADEGQLFDPRFGTGTVLASSQTPGATVLVQNGGVRWLNFRAGPLRFWGGWALIAVLVLLALFLLIRGRIRVKAGRSGIRIERFAPIERFGHWLLAGSFVLLGITGLISLYGRVGLIPVMGRELFATLAAGSKWVHDSTSWAFMVGLLLVFVMWVARNIPNRADLTWLAKGGGMFSKNTHVPARKFNAGQKLMFWGVVILGVSISVSGLSMLFPFQMPLFAKTFGIINDLGLPGLFGADPLNTALVPHEEMQLSQTWHAIVAFAFLCLIFGHIYIGTVGMEGAFEAMGEGDVDLNWAREHHDLWVAELEAERKLPPTGASAPAE